MQAETVKDEKGKVAEVADRRKEEKQQAKEGRNQKEGKERESFPVDVLEEQHSDGYFEIDRTHRNPHIGEILLSG